MSSVRKRIEKALLDALASEGNRIVGGDSSHSVLHDDLEDAEALDSVYSELEDFLGAHPKATEQEMMKEYLRGYRAGLRDHSDGTPEQIEAEVRKHHDESAQPSFDYLPKELSVRLSYAEGYSNGASTGKFYEHSKRASVLSEIQTLEKKASSVVLKYTERKTDWSKSPMKTTQTKGKITGKDLDECFTQYFKMTNSAKYLNDLSYSIDDPKMQEEYKKWFTVDNYARHGGDMW